MKFKRLMASLENAAGDEPDLYMAVCAFEALARDMEEESGGEFADLPIGNEMLPAKLIWLCRTVQSVCAQKDGELLRNRKRLEKEIAALAETVQTLEKASPSEGELAALEEKKRALNGEWARLKEKRSEIVAEIAAAREKCESMQREHQEKEQERLAAQARVQEGEALLRCLQEKLDALVDRLSGLQRQVTELETEKIPAQTRMNADEQARCEKLRGDLDAREKTLGESRRDNDALQERLDRTTDEVLRADERRRALEQEYQTQSARLNALTEEVKRLEEKADRDKYEAFLGETEARRKELQSVADSLRTADQTLAGQDSRLAELNARLQKTRADVAEREEKAGRLEEEKRRLDRRAAELEKLTSAGLEEELREAQRKLSILDESAEHLTKTLAKITKTLGVARTGEETKLLHETRNAVKELSAHADALQKDLLNCADKVSAKLKPGG